MITSATSIQRQSVIEQLAPVLSDANPVLGVMDFNVLDQSIMALREVYPAHRLTSTISVTTMGLPGVLEHFRARGFGVQVSCAAEVAMAQRCGFTTDQIFHTAAVNTGQHLADVTDTGLHLSIDNFAELTRIGELLADPTQYPGSLGVMVTPQASTDDNATAHAHRGVGLRDHRADLIETLLERDWLHHLEVSFDTTPTSLQQTAEQIAAVYRFAEDVEHAAGAQRIRRLIFPAGIPAVLQSDDDSPTFDNHRFVHQAIVPDLFDEKYELIVEATTPLTAPAGMVLARVEHTKDLDGRMIAVIHANHDFSAARVVAYDGAGRRKDDLQHYYYDVAGPSGLVAQRVELPELEPGDVLAFVDLGATVFGTQASFTAPIYGIRADGLLSESSILSGGQSAEALAHAAGIYQPEKLLH